MGHHPSTITDKRIIRLATIEFCFDSLKMIVIVGSLGLLPANGLSAGDDHNSGNAAAKMQQDVQFDR